jgi:hypothetical protein
MVSNEKFSIGDCTLPQMQALKPCARCEQELPESFFDARDAMFCRRCDEEINAILRKKYSIIEAALIRAQLRHSANKLQRKMGSQKAPNKREVAGVGD